MSDTIGHPRAQTAVIEMAGLSWASEKATVDAVLGRRPGVLSVEANPVAQTATVTFDSQRASVAEIAGWVRDCGYHCSGQPVPSAPVRDRDEPAARASGPRRPRGHVDGRHGRRPAPAVPRRGRAERADPAVVEHRPRCLRVRRRGPVRAARRRLPAAAQPAGDPLLGLDLLHRCLARAAGPHAGHDGAGRRRDRGGLGVLARA